jgi:hypothetical protein
MRGCTDKVRLTCCYNEHYCDESMSIGVDNSINTTSSIKCSGTGIVVDNDHSDSDRDGYNYHNNYHNNDYNTNIEVHIAASLQSSSINVYEGYTYGGYKVKHRNAEERAIKSELGDINFGVYDSYVAEPLTRLCALGSRWSDRLRLGLGRGGMEAPALGRNKMRGASVVAFVSPDSIDLMLTGSTEM